MLKQNTAHKTTQTIRGTLHIMMNNKGAKETGIKCKSLTGEEILGIMRKVDRCPNMKQCTYIACMVYGVLC
jgi:hypothetical protein